MINQKTRILNEVWSAITHGIGVFLSIAALVLLILKAIGQANMLALGAYLVYGITLILLYLCSTLFHSLYFTRAQRIFQIFDHCSINFLIAGTYTPYCLLTIKGSMGVMLLVSVWGLACFGMLYHILAKKRRQWIETSLYIVMGWLCLLGVKSLEANLGVDGVLLLFLGGVSFTIGALIYSIHGVKYLHVIWHLFVLLGTILMYFSIYFYID
jgi:hemolysin III